MLKLSKLSQLLIVAHLVLSSKTRDSNQAKASKQNFTTVENLQSRLYYSPIYIFTTYEFIFPIQDSQDQFAYFSPFPSKI